MASIFSIIIYGYGKTQLISKDKNVTSPTSSLPSGGSMINAILEDAPPEFNDNGLHYILIIGNSDFSEKASANSRIFYVSKLIESPKPTDVNWFSLTDQDVGINLIQSLYDELNRS